MTTGVSECVGVLQRTLSRATTARASPWAPLGLGELAGWPIGAVSPESAPTRTPARATRPRRSRRSSVHGQSISSAMNRRRACPHVLVWRPVEQFRPVLPVAIAGFGQRAARTPAARAGVEAVAVIDARRARSCRAARWGRRNGRIRAPCMCTRPPLVAPPRSPCLRRRTFRLPVAPPRANVDGRRLPAAATTRRNRVHDLARNRLVHQPR